jgi:hypothetical protein
MKHKVGDTVRIQSQEWYDVHKDENGFVHYSNGSMVFNSYMQKSVGKLAKVVSVNFGSYTLDIDNGKSYWQDWMLDSDYCPEDEPLSAEDAIIAMVQGRETLYDKTKHQYFWDSNNRLFVKVFGDGLHISEQVSVFDVELYRRPAKCSRDMTRWEVLAWADSEESRGWLVMCLEIGDWCLPQYFAYADGADGYQRARLLPDCSGVDKNTIQGFEVEE